MRSLSPTPTFGAERIDIRLPAFRIEAADQTHATCMPDTAWPIDRAPARLIPGSH
jgi:hypothetical protein